MRALLIDKTGVREVNVEPDNPESFKKVIGCECLALGGYPDAKHVAWIDDEGLLKDLDGEQGTEVSWYHQALAGKILVTGFEIGNPSTPPAAMSVRKLSSMVRIGHFSVNKEA